MPRKRASSFKGLFSKLLPSRRPERGGTLRKEDNSGDSAYLDLGIQPEQLTQWNVAEELSPLRRAEIESLANRQALGVEPLKLVHPTHSLDLKLSVGRQPVSHVSSEPMSVAQAQALLESKEQTRQQRRELKASGDFLPVTGYDPWTGEWAVLTPTDTLSSDTTSPSTGEMIDRLEQHVREARQVYEHARTQVELSKERIALEKAQTKLAKIEKKKANLKEYDGTVRWKQNRRYWSSVAEPILNPIAQCDHSNHIRRYGRHQQDHSGNTIVHMRPLQTCNRVSFANPLAMSPNTVDSSPTKDTDKMPFLWDRRLRHKKLENTAVGQAIAISSSTTGMAKTKSDSLITLGNSKRLIDLKIPNYHNIIETRIKTPVSVSSPEGSIHTPGQSWTPDTDLSELSSSSNLILPGPMAPNQQTGCGGTTSAVTATSSRLKPKDSRMNISHLQSLAPNQLETSPPCTVRRGHTQHNFGLHQKFLFSREHRMKGTLTTNITPAERMKNNKTRYQEVIKRAAYGDTYTKIGHQQLSAFIPITTITGYDQDPMSHLSKEHHYNHMDKEATEKHINIGTMSAVQQAHEQNCELRAPREQNTMSFRPSMPLRGLQNGEHRPKRPKTDFTSGRGITIRKSYLQDCFPKTPRICHISRPVGQGNCQGLEVEKLRKVKSHKATLYQSFQDEQLDIAAQTAARMAMLKSRVTVGDSPLQFCALRKGGSAMILYNKIMKGECQSNACKQPMKEIFPSAANEGIGAPFMFSDPSQKTGTDIVTIPYVICVLVVNSATEISFAWWLLVKPAFDRQSDLWRRRQDGRSTLWDLVVFSSAGVFCMIGTCVVWYSSRLLIWLCF